jgi:cytochrome b561
MKGVPMPTNRYSGITMILHWLLAIGVIANWRIAEAAEHAPEAEAGKSWHRTSR